MPSPPHPILIIGAGISGLSLAQGLLQSHIPFRIFERDPLLNIRSQGYRVRINTSGITALTSLLPPTLFARLEASCAITAGNKSMHPTASLNALTGEKLERRYQSPPEEREPLNADRTVLRRVLFEGLEDFVSFRKEFLGYESVPEGGVKVRFSDESEVLGSLLVGADGTSSRVKAQFCPGQELVDTEGRWIYGKTTLTAEVVRRFNGEALKGLTVVQDGRVEGMPRTLLLEPVRFKDNEFRSGLPDDYVYWVLMSRKDGINMDDAELLNLPAEKAAALASKLSNDWDASFHALFDLQDTAQTSILRIASARPDIPMWEPSNIVTLIGDAIHVMSPTAGVGATSALHDAASLSQLLAGKGTSAEAIGKYEESMRVYAGEAISRSTLGGKALFGMQLFEELKAVSG